jgi:hypothetical protein
MMESTGEGDDDDADDDEEAAVELTINPPVSSNLPHTFTHLTNNNNTHEQNSFGWLFPAQQILLGHVLGEGTRVVVQLGAYLGKTTLFIAEQAPRVGGWVGCLIVYCVICMICGLLGGCCFWSGGWGWGARCFCVCVLCVRARCMIVASHPSTSTYPNWPPIPPPPKTHTHRPPLPQSTISQPPSPHPPTLPQNTQALIFVVDPWDNAVLKQEPSLNKNFANIDLFDRVPFHPTFLRNTWGLRAREGKDPRDPSRLVGVVPMRCVAIGVVSWCRSVGL